MYSCLLRCLSLVPALTCLMLDASAADGTMGANKTAWQDLGHGVVLQHATGLRWTRQDNRQDIDWAGAKSWCARLGQGWRLPTVDELSGLHAAAARDGSHVACGKSECNVPPQFKLSAAWHWSDAPLTKAEARDADELAWGMTLVNGRKTMALRLAAYGARALCVHDR